MTKLNSKHLIRKEVNKTLNTGERKGKLIRFLSQVEKADGARDAGYSNEGSESSLSSVKTDPSKTYDADSIDLHLEQTSKKKQFMKAHRNKSSYNLSAAKFSKGEQNLSQVALGEAQDKFR